MDKWIVVGLGVLALAVWVIGRWLGRRTLGEPRELSAADRERIDDEVRAGRAIAAIKFYRDGTGFNLVMAKDAIDRWPPERSPGP